MKNKNIKKTNSRKNPVIQKSLESKKGVLKNSERERVEQKRKEEIEKKKEEMRMRILKEKLKEKKEEREWAPYMKRKGNHSPRKEKIEKSIFKENEDWRDFISPKKLEEISRTLPRELWCKLSFHKQLIDYVENKE